MKLVMASCSKIQDRSVSQDVWSEIAAERPDALLLLGDNVYLEHDHHTDPTALGEELSERYAEQFAEPHFSALLAQLDADHRPVIACYDDHDFLGNDRCGGDVPITLREAARRAFVDRWCPPQTGDDVYARFKLGMIDVLLLDTRFYREQRFAPGSTTRDAVLGSRQWSWLESEINAVSPCRFLMIASGSTFHDFSRTECWEYYPAAFQRMRTLIAHKPGVLFLSGDIHINTLYDDSGVVEVVSSGVARRGAVFGGLRRNYGVLTFDEKGVRVELRSNKAPWRFDKQIALDNWKLD